MSKKTSTQKKIKVAEKCNWRCAYCGCELDLETMCIDHFLPKAKGGSNHLENLMPSCRSCNSTKGTSDLETFRLRVAVHKKTNGIKFTADQINFLKEKNVLTVLKVEPELFFFEQKQG
ncbi:HNH endonuclease [Kingella oralis]|jgi:hypothetical protein|uniref:HNH endonuclease n=1 Tax=Kingella oralis TaxID=505 RepID=UPI000590FAA5|nr:HNH endonuclease signature motif containing protein [Kingella oralis]QMT41792.1 HNH endonuclease [Kingella oralis]DAJ62417.1 MAG TPA: RECOMBINATION ENDONUCLEASE VII [Caudoviricetes sp.]